MFFCLHVSTVKRLQPVLDSTTWIGIRESLCSNAYRAMARNSLNLQRAEGKKFY